jgi:pimeloyl-ACP methyl ester carboxylesterase
VTGDDAAADVESGSARTPFDLLHPLASQEVWVTDELRHVEVYTLEGLLTLLWHGDPGAEHVVLACGGAMGGLLGPAHGLYHELGTRFARDGIATIRVGYRRPNNVPKCAHDLAAAADLASRTGGRRFVTMGHSFGGAVAVQAGCILGPTLAGVVTLSTQSAGCEHADELPPHAPLLLLHGDRDELLPPEASAMVQMLAGRGEIEVLPGAGHLLTEASEHLRRRLVEWIPAAFAAAATDEPDRRQS